MTTKTFDSVKLMRDLRDRLSQELEPLSPEERARCIRERAALSGLGKRFAEKKSGAAQETAPPVRRQSGR